jgi:hypothetical protein
VGRTTRPVYGKIERERTAELADKILRFCVGRRGRARRCRAEVRNVPPTMYF